MTDPLNPTTTPLNAPYPLPLNELDRIGSADAPRLADQLSCARVSVGRWNDYGVRTLVNAEDCYASVQLRIPQGLPTAWAVRLAKFATQHMPYTDRDREWDAVSHGGVTSNSDLWNCFVDSTLAAESFAERAVEHAVWAHARGEEWDWPYPVPGRVENKYEHWGDQHPLTYDFGNEPAALKAVAEDHRSRPGAPTEADIEF